jgi:hypothetical protein
MNDERWGQLKSQLKKNFTVDERGTEDIVRQTADGPVKQGELEFLVVKTPMGKIRVSRESRPLVLEKKYHYTHRQGAAAQTEYKFSDTEKTHKLKVYKWDDVQDDWKEINAEGLGGMV